MPILVYYGDTTNEYQIKTQSTFYMYIVNIQSYKLYNRQTITKRCAIYILLFRIIYIEYQGSIVTWQFSFLSAKDEAVWVGGEWTNIHTINTSLGNISAKSVTGLSSFKGSGCLALNCMSQMMTVQNCGRSLPFMCGIEAVETP